MPIYEYLCDGCSHRFERLKAKMVKNSKEKCPKCGGRAPQQLSPFGVGSGNSTGETPCGVDACPSAGGACASGACPYSQN